MTKSIVAGVVALVLVLSCGIVEVVLLKRDYQELHAQCTAVIALAKDDGLTVERYKKFREAWVSLREKSELLLPHQDVYELNLRFAESQAYVEQHDSKQLLAQLAVIEELLRYVPHLMTPSFTHIL